MYCIPMYVFLFEYILKELVISEAKTQLCFTSEHNILFIKYFAINNTRSVRFFGGTLQFCSHFYFNLYYRFNTTSPRTGSNFWVGV